MRGEFRQNSFADGRFVEVWCRCQLFASALGAGSLPDGAEDGKPELLGILLVAPHLHSREPVALARAIRPGPQQGSLAAASGGRDQGYLCFRRAVESGEKFSALNQLRSCRARP